MTIAMMPSQEAQDDPPNPPTNQGGEPEGTIGMSDMGEPEFPMVALSRLDEMIHRQRWIVPVLPKSELEILLDASIILCSKGLDIKSEPCQRFFREGCTVSFTKILTDDAVCSWKFDIHKCVLKNSAKLIELVALKFSQDWFPLLDLLAMVLNPSNKFHTFNSARQSESANPNSNLKESEMFAKPPDQRNPRGWLVDLINLFGKLGGFRTLLERFEGGKNLSVAVVCAYLRPFGLCYEMLAVSTIETYFMPIIEMVPTFLENLTDEELKKEAKNEAKNDALSTIIKTIKCLLSRVPSQQEMCKSLEIFRLKMILRLLQISSFNGKMNALNEVNKVITNVLYHPHRHGQLEEEEWLTAERMAEWIKENKVLQIVLRDSLHQPQYVEKLEKIIRFIIKEKTMTLEDLDDIWSAQHGKHEAIVKNIHDLLAKLAWDFSPEQLDHLFRCFQTSWSQASKKQREKLLELIRRLAEDDKDGVMAHKVLTLLWSLAHSDDLPTDIMDQALNAHVKILDYSCSQDRDYQKKQWLDKCVEELKHDKWVLPALKQIREICCSYTESPNMNQHQPRPPHVSYRNDVISDLQSNHMLVILVSNNLVKYMANIKQMVEKNANVNVVDIIPDGRYNHIQQVQDRLHFLRFLLKDGRLWLCSPQAKQIWKCLAEEAVFPIDRESCFKWFSKLMGDDPDLDPDINKEFFEDNILQLNPTLLTEHGMRCFERFFRTVNLKEGKLVLRRRTYFMDNEDLIGIDYIWKVVLCSNEDIAQRAIALLKETYTNLGPKLQTNVIDIHEDFISNCRSRLKAMYDTVSVLEKDKDSLNRTRQETTKMCRVLKVLYEYVAECDADFGDERTLLPMVRASRGKHIYIVVRFVIQGRGPDDIEIWPHTNDTVGFIRRQVMQRLKAMAANLKVELYLNNELLSYADDKRIICNMPIREKTMLTGKLVQSGSNMASSPDSSSDSSTNSPQHPYEAPNVEVENSLPGVLMSMQNEYCKFLLKLADLGCTQNLPTLRDSARLLLSTMPADRATVHYLEKMCHDPADPGGSTDGNLLASLEETFFHSSPSTILYNLQVLYSWLMPASNIYKDKSHEFPYNLQIITLMKSGGLKLVINMLTKKSFLANGDLATKKSACLVVLKVAKLIFTTLAFAIVEHEPFSSGELDSHMISNGMEGRGYTPSAQVLQMALTHIPSPQSDVMVRSVSQRLVQLLSNHPSFTLMLWDQFCTGIFPDMTLIDAILKIAWAGASGHFQFFSSSWPQIEKLNVSFSPDQEDLQVCIEGLETLSVALTLYPPALDVLLKEPHFHKMILSLVISSPERAIRVTAVEQVVLIATKCSPTPHTLVLFIDMLFQMFVCHNQSYSKEYFQLLCGLLNWACVSKVCLPSAENLLSAEIDWLKRVRERVVVDCSSNTFPTGELVVDEILLDGHLCVTRELIAFLPAEKKYDIGGDAKGVSLIKELIEDFIFPFSKVYLQLEHASLIPVEQAIPVCSSQPTVIAAYDLLVTLCTGCVRNLTILADMLTNMYYSDYEDFALEWDFVPPIGPRPFRGFVGLKNAGATCYMNSVLQQLYMIRQVREGVLQVQGAATDFDEDFSGEDRLEQETANEMAEEDSSVVANEGSRKEYHIGILKQVQAIFGHLACSKLQYYVPRGLWRHFKLQGEPVNLREQHDACEFYNILVESINEAMKALGEPQVLNKILGGSFSDQKICKTCPHRYSREEAFTVISIDIRNYSNLHDSLDQYVKGDLLEGDNAYLCEKCDKKVDTVKRICLKKLPTILAIQLKRFDYDWERECSIKFNDYFEFPRDLDMEPYTVAGLARNGELIDYEPEDLKNQCCSKYKLTGIVVHSGQASGGHYYSYVLHRTEKEERWYKFDDGDVSECKMEDEEEIKIQCFGGEYMGEQAFDNIMKRMNCRPRKRWWNAYLLFYTRLEGDDSDLASQMNELTLADYPSRTKMPSAIERSVVRQNVRFMHSRSQFSTEYFQFMKKLIMTNHSFIVQPPPDKLNEVEEIALVCTKLASKFLFSVGFHTKKTLRGPASDWYDALQIHLQAFSSTRAWFTQNILFAQPQRFVDYLLECPTPEVRQVFSKLIGLIAHTSRDDPAQLVAWPSLRNYTDGPVAIYSLSDQLLVAVLLLLNKDLSDHGRHLLHYFNMFHSYANLGPAERLQLLKLNVLETLILVALEDGPTHQKLQYQDASKMYVVISQLVRCCNVSHLCRSSQPDTPVLKNPFAEPHSENLTTIHPKVMEFLYNRATYIKRVIEEANSCEDTIKLVKFCAWENPTLSSVVLSELLWQISTGYTYELRPFFELILHILFLEDSWQDHRIHNTLKGLFLGFHKEREGIFDVIASSKHTQQKRAYQCIKFLVNLFSSSTSARRMLLQSGELKGKWHEAVCWLNEELERNAYANSNQQYYNTWSAPVPSNETTNGYFLERSASARSTLEKACELCPEEEVESEDIEEVEQGSVAEEQVASSSRPSSGRPPSPTHQPKQTSTTPPTSRSSCTIGPTKSFPDYTASSTDKGEKHSKMQSDNS